MPDDAVSKGMRLRREVLGDEHVDRATARSNSFDERFQHFITESAWGNVWSNKELDCRTRSLVTIALLAALGHTEELAMHIRASRNTGATTDEIREALMHVAVYAGVPAANQAFAVAKRVLLELDAEGESDE